MNNKEKIIIAITCILLVIVIVIFVFKKNNNIDNQNIVSNQVNQNVSLNNNQVDDENIVSENIVDNNIVENDVAENTSVSTNNDSNINPSNPQSVYETNTDIGTTNKKQEAINLVKEKWGEDNTVTFSCDSVTTSGEYIVAVTSIQTATVKNYFIVNLENKTVTVDY